MYKKTLCLFVASLLALATSAALAETYDVSQPPGNNFDKAEFRLWLPENIDFVRATLVLVPGSNSDGRDQVENRLWQSLAEEQHLAVVAIHMTDKTHEDMFVEHYVDVRRGSGDAFLTALDQLGKLSGHPEISAAPLLLWGMSAGGEFNYEFALWRPDRVAGFIVNKGGIYYSALASAEARTVPGLFFVGTEDLAFRNDIIRGIFSINRRAHARWALIEQDGVAHAVAGSDLIAADFYRQVIQERVADDGSLSPLDLASSYLCNPDSLECVPTATADTPREPVSWLVNEALAVVWQDAHRSQKEVEPIN
jgi:poly(3-hydroxybutyrate) depolymerase